MAGINLGGGSANKTALGLEILKSRKFISEFIERRDILAPLMAAGGVIVADQAMKHPTWIALALPAGVPEGRYFMYRVAAG